MSELEDGGPAFPLSIALHPETKQTGYSMLPITHGMSLRDWFAGLAMQGYISADPECSLQVEDVAVWAYKDADFMLKARNAKDK